MSSTIKVSLLALISTVAAVPHYGANPHSQFHHRASGTGAYGQGPHGTGKPYPTGGFPGSYNSTAVPYPTGTGYGDKTIDETSTSTTTVYKTVHVKPSSAAGAASGVYEATGVAAENVPTASSNGQCGPATVTVTASEKVTITVTPGGGADYTPAPGSSAAPVESQQGNGYGAPSSGNYVIVSQTPAAEKPTSAPAAEYPAGTPKKEATPSSAAAQYPAETPKAPEATSSKAEGYVAPSYAQKQPEVYSSAAPVAYSSAAQSAAPSASSKPSSGNTYTGTKRGLAYNEASLCSSFGSKFGYGYNWGQVENNDIGTNFIPMMHGPSKSTAEEWLANVDKAVKKGSKAVMGFNECDVAEQCNLSPAAACSAWKQYMNPVKTNHPDITIIGPSVTNGEKRADGSPMGLNWLTEFHTACPDATVDATNIHFYDIYEENQTLARFKAQVEKAAAIYGNKVWITEFGLNPGAATSDQAVTFLKGAMEYLDNSDSVQGYSWFMVGTGENQLNSGTGLSPVGEAYAGSS